MLLGELPSNTSSVINSMFCLIQFIQDWVTLHISDTQMGPTGKDDGSLRWSYGSHDCTSPVHLFSL